MYKCFASMCVYIWTTCMPSVFVGQKRVLDPMDPMVINSFESPCEFWEPTHVLGKSS